MGTATASPATKSAKPTGRATKSESGVSLMETSYSGTPHTIDREAGIIRGVKVLGSNSKNGRSYSPRALATAAKLYEGVAVNVDHPSRENPGRERGVAERFGELRDATVRGDGVYADLHFLKSHPLAAAVCESAERQPHHVGLSHNAVGNVVRRGDAEIVEDIQRVRSVDLVTRPATNSSLFESEDDPMADAKKTVTRKLSEILESHSGGKGKAALKSLLEMDGMADAGALPMDVPAEASADDQAAAAFKAMVAAVMDDDSLDTAAKKKKIGEILAAQEKLTAKADAPAESGDAGGESKPAETPESIAELRRKVARMERESAARELLESKGIDATAVRVKAVAALESAADREALAATWPKGRGVAGGTATRPATSAPLMESARDLPALDSPAAVAAFLRG